MSSNFFQKNKIKINKLFKNKSFKNFIINSVCTLNLAKKTIFFLTQLSINNQPLTLKLEHVLLMPN